VIPLAYAAWGSLMHIVDFKNTVSDTTFSWLSSKVSLTRRLREFTHNQISHHLFYDDWGTASDQAIASLNINSDTKTWIRKMQWRMSDEIWVACDVIIPESSITDKTVILKQIGKNSIGDILFQDTNLQRSNFEFFISGSTITRHSIFYFYDQPLLITETFLPAFFQAIEST
jgi:chorismate-pyruvate lyase